jgi:hypothetical protein
VDGLAVGLHQGQELALRLERERRTQGLVDPLERQRGGCDQQQAAWGQGLRWELPSGQVARVVTQEPVAEVHVLVADVGDLDPVGALLRPLHQRCVAHRHQLVDAEQRGRLLDRGDVDDRSVFEPDVLDLWLPHLGQRFHVLGGRVGGRDDVRFLDHLVV